MEQTHPPAQAAHAAHPQPPVYIGVFRWLAAFTVIELLVSFISVNEIKVPVLVVFAVLKAALVALYYMHLRYDSRWYAVVMLAGAFFAVLVGRFLPLVQK